jgi:hypothetical protein
LELVVVVWLEGVGVEREGGRGCEDRMELCFVFLLGEDRGYMRWVC